MFRKNRCLVPKNDSFFRYSPSYSHKFNVRASFLTYTILDMNREMLNELEEKSLGFWTEAFTIYSYIRNRISSDRCQIYGKTPYDSVTLTGIRLELEHIQ